MLHRLIWLSVFLGVIASRVSGGEMPWVRVSDDKHGFVLSTSAKPFVPWGFNYDHDENGRLLEENWDKEWHRVEQDFLEMKQLGANVVRIHLQIGKFMTDREKTNQANLERLGLLVGTAEKLGVYLDVTGLACYRKKDVPDWYDRLDEEQRWAVQSRFWEAVAERCAKSPAIFSYDLMNEPVVPGGARKPGDWLGPPFMDGDSGYFVQCITLDQKDRPRPAIARQWCHRLVTAIRKQDQRHLVTVGLVPWSLDRPGLTSGFVPKEIAPELDFVSVHLYPEKDKIKEAMETLSGFEVGKPVIIEEMFPLNCSIPEFERFLDESRKAAFGWIGFYWGKTLEECRKSNTIQDAFMIRWLEFFQKRAGEAEIAEKARR
jgi:Cellulase (glycosyl hydrolase family 5)